MTDLTTCFGEGDVGKRVGLGGEEGEAYDQDVN